MKLLINKIKAAGLALAVGFGLTMAAQAQYSITNFTLVSGIKTNQLFINAVNIAYIKFTTTTLPTGTNAVINFYDNNTSNNITYTNIAYTNYVTVKTNVTFVSTNSFGNLQTNTYPGQWTYEEVVVANTNALPAIATFNLGANTSSTQTRNIVTAKGLIVKSMTDFTNGVVEIGYSTSP